MVHTPAFNRLAVEDVLFEKAFVSSSSCTPSRGVFLTGQDFRRSKEGANLWSTLDVVLPVCSLLLEEAGYFVGSWRKSWGSGNLEAGGIPTNHLQVKNTPEVLRNSFLQSRKVCLFAFG